MATLTADIAVEVHAACRQGVAEIGEALSRTFDAPMTVTVGEAATLSPAALPADWQGPGLVIAMLVGGVAALAIMPESSGLLPAWYKSPDATGESKLMTLAQELGMLVLPEALMPEDFKAGRVANLAASLGRAELAAAAGHLPLNLTAASRQGTMHVVWPVAKIASLFDAATSDASAESPPSDATPAGEAPVAPYDAASDPFRRLPHYAQSLLRINVAVRVRLAQKRQRVDDIVSLGPGQIIQFEKSCDEMLDLLVGNQCVANGEAVKVGDKFGLRVTSIALPEERFRKVG